MVESGDEAWHYLRRSLASARDFKVPRLSDRDGRREFERMEDNGDEAWHYLRRSLASARDFK